MAGPKTEKTGAGQPERQRRSTKKRSSCSSGFGKEKAKWQVLESVPQPGPVEGPFRGIGSRTQPATCGLSYSHRVPAPSFLTSRRVLSRSRFLRRLATYTLARGAYRAMDAAKPAPTHRTRPRTRARPLLAAHSPLPTRTAAASIAEICTCEASLCRMRVAVAVSGQSTPTDRVGSGRLPAPFGTRAKPSPLVPPPPCATRFQCPLDFCTLFCTLIDVRTFCLTGTALSGSTASARGWRGQCPRPPTARGGSSHRQRPPDGPLLADNPRGKSRHG
jgi:hypothetical protein